MRFWRGGDSNPRYPVIHQLLQDRIRDAVRLVLPDADTADIEAVLVRPCPDPKFGDYQCNALMSLAKARKLNPRQLANEVLARLDANEWCEKVELAGAGFLNFRLKIPALARALETAAASKHPFVEQTKQPHTVVIDFSSPNVAKPMHVGHIRSTILGDCLSRTLRLLGHHVITDNHIGDWGTQFGMLIVGWKTLLDRAALGREPLAEMERIYKAVQSKCDPEKSGYDAATHEAARAELVKLQNGDTDNLKIWREMIELSQKQFDEIYSRLGVKFDHSFGESFYNDKVKQVYDELTAHSIAVESEGALVVFQNQPEAPANIKGHPFIIRKRDGASNYASTDLATVLYRKEALRADAVLYVVDSRQRDHFDHLFSTAGKWFKATERNLFEPKLIDFGTILGEDNKPLKTRSGENVKLRDLLDEAEERALKIVSEKNPELPEAQQREIARIVGIGAVKYADLLPNRTSDYVFSWDKMLALNGNTAPYLQYAYTRVRSIFRKGGAEQGERGIQNVELKLSALEEIALGKHLLNFGLTLDAVAGEYRPNYLCNYLYELAGHFARFYENCPVLKAAESDRASRLVLCNLTAQVLKEGLGVLGIETTEQM
ncbi:MAG TPA: arginine--tRNA ligase [Candidatus Angelobacter sp.]|nr:arginine--tRNA ligase [Candidatus Angelobacter sp.]